MSEAKRERKPPEIGGYVIEVHLGQGGMGDVWKARQEGTNRAVAIKMIRSMELPDEIQMARFQLEAELIAHVQDPNIVQIFHTGKIGERPYLVMEFVGGGTLADGMTDRAFEPQEAARLIETLALAIGKVHRKGIVHRDLKPSNILIDEAGAPKIADFGLARLSKLPTSDQSRGMVIGTPGYMSPEQILGANPVLTVASETDIFALGVILYQLLTGQHPFQADSDFEAKKLACNANPKSPRLIRREVPRDLEAICLKCLEKKRFRRYPDGVALAEDLERFLQDRPTLARPIGGGGRAWRWCLRNPLATCLIALALVGSALAVAYRSEAGRRREAELKADAEGAKSLALDVEARSARSLAEQRQAQVDENTYFNAIAAVAREYSAGNLARAEQLLDRCLPQPGGTDFRNWEYHFLRGRLESDLLRVTFTPRRYGWEPRILPLSFSNDDRKLFMGPGYSIELAGLDGPGPRRVGFEPRREDLWFQPFKERFNAVVSDDGKVAGVPLVTEQGVALYRWRPPTGLPGSLPYDEIGRLAGLDGQVIDVCFSDDDRRVAALVEDSTLRVWDVETGRELSRLKVVRTSESTINIGTVAFAPGGKTLASLFWDATDQGQTLNHNLIVWDIGEATPRFAPLVVNRFGVETYVLQPGMTNQTGLTFSPDGKKLAYAPNGGLRFIRIVNATTGDRLADLNGHNCATKILRFFPDGRRIASGGSDGQIGIWDVSGDQPLMEGMARISGREIKALAISRDGRLLATSDELEVKVWDPRRLPGIERLVSPPNPSKPQPSMAEYQNGIYLTRDFQVWDSRTGARVALADVQEHWKTDQYGMTAFAFSPDGKRLAVGVGNAVHVWEVATGRHLNVFDRHRPFVGSVAFNPDGSRIASIGGSLPFGERPKQSDLWVWDASPNGPTPGEPLEMMLTAADFEESPDVIFRPTRGQGEEVVILGRASISRDGDSRSVQSVALVFDGRTGKQRAVVWGLNGLTFDPTGRFEARAFDEGRIEILESETGRIASTFIVPSSPPSGVTIYGYSLAFNRDGTRLLSAPKWGAVLVEGDPPAVAPSAVLWDPIRGREALDFSGIDPGVGPDWFAFFSIDGNSLVSPSHGVWNGTPAPEGSKPAVPSRPGKPRDGHLP
jgi:eukaryotic-like serine/threonine-protein kinase